jgi:hypothetical protein
MDNYSSYSSSDGGAFAAMFGALMIPFFIIYIVLIIANWKIYEKAGKPGWAAIIPIYNIVVLLEIVGKPVWWIILFLIPCVNIIFAVWTINLLSKSFGQSEGFTIGLLLLGVVFFPILAFGNYQYQGPAAAEARGKWTPQNPFPTDNFRDPNSPPPPPQY